ncbi:MAG: TIGR02300 family protein [Pseudomonadota bacterium]
MPKPEWGVKRTCLTCAARFYDMMRDPIVCPNCGAEFDVVVAAKPRRAKAPAKAAAVVVPAAEALVDAEDSEDEEAEDSEAADAVDGAETISLAETEDDDDDTAGPTTSDDAADTDDDAEEEAEEEDELGDFESDVLLEDEEDDDDLDDLGTERKTGNEDET